MILVVAGITYGVLRLSERIVGVIGINGMNALSKVMGFIILCIGIQFVVNGVLGIVQDPTVIRAIRDAALPARYTARTLSRRGVNKRALEAAFALDTGDGPILAVVSRLTRQKGMDVLAECVDDLVETGARLALLGPASVPAVGGTDPALQLTVGADSAGVFLPMALRRGGPGATFVVASSDSSVAQHASAMPSSRSMSIRAKGFAGPRSTSPSVT